jgi:hypothetical protein
VDWGVAREHILKYEDHWKTGHYLMLVHGDAQTVKEAQTLLSDTNTADIYTYTAEPVAAQPTNRTTSQREEITVPVFCFAELWGVAVWCVWTTRPPDPGPLGGSTGAPALGGK